MAMKLGVVH